MSRLARRAAERRLLLGRKIARVVHDVRPRRAAVARHVHREHVEAGGREIRHPAVVGVRHVERHLGRRAGAVHEQHDAIVARRAALDRRGLHALAHVELRRLAFDRRHDGPIRNVVIDGQNVLAVLAGRRLCEARPDAPATAKTRSRSYARTPPENAAVIVAGLQGDGFILSEKGTDLFFCAFDAGPDSSADRRGAEK